MNFSFDKKRCSCIDGAKATKYDNIFLITDHESEIIEEGYTIQVIPIGEWLTREW